jgi:phosphoribosylformylglycinamidine synthase
MEAKRAGDLLVLVGETTSVMGGSHFARLRGGSGLDARLPLVDLEQGPRRARAVHALIRCGVVRAAHDPSEGGLLVAAAEMAMAGGLGVELDDTLLPRIAGLHDAAQWFAETPSRYLLEVSRDALADLGPLLDGIPHAIVGELNDSGRLTLAGRSLDVEIAELAAAWQSGLNW